MGHLFFWGISLGAGRPLPPLDVSGIWWQSSFPDPPKKKKKKKKWEEAKAGVVWKWELHMGSEVEAMQWYTGTVEQEVGLVEGASPVACGKQHKHGGNRIQADTIRKSP